MGCKFNLKLNNGEKMKSILLILAVVLFSCKTTPQVTEDSAKQKETKVTSQSTNTPEMIDKTSVEQAISHNDSRFNFKIDDTVTVEDLNQKIKNLFEAIEEKIATGDFDGWYNALSYKHRKHISDKTVLQNMSKESDYLYTRNITLETPKDYFLNIVMPSRKGYSLKYINYEKVSQNHIKVNCVLDGTIKFVYDFVNEDGSWKVDRK